MDGFRFDIMSCLMVSTMEKARDALRGLTLERDGVDGSCLYLYGEGWDFGEVTAEHFVSCAPDVYLCTEPRAERWRLNCSQRWMDGQMSPAVCCRRRV